MCWVGSRRIMSYVTVLYANVPVWWFGLHYFLAQAQIDCHKIFFVAAWVVQQLAIDSESLIQNVQVPRYCTNSSWFLHYRKFAIHTEPKDTPRTTFGLHNPCAMKSRKAALSRGYSEDLRHATASGTWRGRQVQDWWVLQIFGYNPKYLIGLRFTYFSATLIWSAGGITSFTAMPWHLPSICNIQES